MNKTFIKITHTEYLNDSVSEIGTLLNYDDGYEFINKSVSQNTASYAYFYKSNTYIIFESLANLFDFMIYGDTKTNRAYLSEEDFDKLYNNDGFQGTFYEKLEWVD